MTVRADPGPPLARRIAPLDACAAPGQLVDDDGEPLGARGIAQGLAAARARAEG
ncbi:hypothetical protein [Clavibacter michiganensis]|uniref:hypothetical protein n=1 Tax=Clavibacter michiganensis TaxID=28447 RepID=UPI0029313DFF|nr:hypothetical protein [Clavibacter michiganensis]